MYKEKPIPMGTWERRVQEEGVDTRLRTPKQDNYLRIDKGVVYVVRPRPEETIKYD